MVAASIILYNPELTCLRENIESIVDQVEVVYLVDNGSKNSAANKEMAATWEKCRYIDNGKNLGIARALNIAMEQAKKDGAGWVLTLD